MISKSLPTITEADLIALKDERRIEDKYIEYKSKLADGATQKDLEEYRTAWLWKPIASFANTDGGDLIIGITDNRGAPNLINGVRVADVDRAKGEIENLVKSGIEPRVRLVGIRPVPLANGNTVFVIRVPRSWSGPHRIKANREFYYRTSAGALEMDIATIRREFLLSESLGERINAFREKRNKEISLLTTADRPYLYPRTPVRLEDGARIVAQIVPIESFANPPSLALPQLRAMGLHLATVLNIGGGTQWSQNNFAGLVSVSGASENPARAYLQFYRNAVIEYVRVYSTAQYRQRGIPATEYESRILRFLKLGIEALRQQDIGLPVIVFLSFLDARAFTFGVSAATHDRVGGVHDFGADLLPAPEIVIDDDAEPIHRKMRPLFDMFWNQVGADASPNFDDNGDWTGGAY